MGQGDGPPLATPWEAGTAALFGDLSTLTCPDGGGLVCWGGSGFWTVAGLLSFAGGILGETGGVVLLSSWTAEVINVDAELKSEEPKPNIFPLMDSSGFAGSLLAPPNPKKPPDSCFGAGAALLCLRAAWLVCWDPDVIWVPGVIFWADAELACFWLSGPLVDSLLAGTLDVCNFSGDPGIDMSFLAVTEGFSGGGTTLGVDFFTGGPGGSAPPWALWSWQVRQSHSWPFEGTEPDH